MQIFQLHSIVTKPQFISCLHICILVQKCKQRSNLWLYLVDVKTCYLRLLFNLSKVCLWLEIKIQQKYYRVIKDFFFYFDKFGPPYVMYLQLGMCGEENIYHVWYSYRYHLYKDVKGVDFTIIIVLCQLKDKRSCHPCVRIK